MPKRRFSTRPTANTSRYRAAASKKVSAGAIWASEKKAGGIGERRCWQTSQRLRWIKLRPSRSRFGRLHGGVDERHAEHPVVHGRKIDVGRDRLACGLSLDRPCGFQVNVCERFDEGFRVAGGQPGEPFG